MAKYLDSHLYKEDVQRVAEQVLPWEKMENKCILICGATGLIGSFLVDVLMYKTHTII